MTVHNKVPNTGLWTPRLLEKLLPIKPKRRSPSTIQNKPCLQQHLSLRRNPKQFWWTTPIQRVLAWLHKRCSFCSRRKFWGLDSHFAMLASTRAISAFLLRTLHAITTSWFHVVGVWWWSFGKVAPSLRFDCLALISVAIALPKIEATAADQVRSKLCALLGSSDFARVFLAGLCYCQVLF